jgi:hypothetical protein
MAADGFADELALTRRAGMLDASAAASGQRIQSGTLAPDESACSECGQAGAIQPRCEQVVQR